MFAGPGREWGTIRQLLRTHKKLKRIFSITFQKVSAIVGYKPFNHVLQLYTLYTIRTLSKDRNFSLLDAGRDFRRTLPRHVRYFQISILCLSSRRHCLEVRSFVFQASCFLPAHLIFNSLIWTQLEIRSFWALPSTLELLVQHTFTIPKTRFIQVC